MGNTNSLNQTESKNNPKKNEIENNIKLLFQSGFDTSSVVSEDKFTEDYNNFIVNQLGGSNVRKNSKRNRFEKFKHIDNLEIDLNSDNQELDRIKSILENNQFGGDSDYEVSDLIFTDSTDKLLSANENIFQKNNISERSNSVVSDTSNVSFSQNIDTNELSATSVDSKGSLSQTSDRVFSQNINTSALSETSVSDNLSNNLDATSSFNESIASNLSDTSINANLQGGYLTESTSANDLVGGEIDNPLSEKEEQKGGYLSETSTEDGLIGGNMSETSSNNELINTDLSATSIDNELVGGNMDNNELSATSADNQLFGGYLSATSSEEGLIGGNISQTSEDLELQNKVDNYSNTSSEEAQFGGNNLVNNQRQNSFEEQQIPQEFQEYINNIPEIKYHDIMSNNSQSSELDTLNFNNTDENLNMDYNMAGGQLSEIKSPTESITSTENNEHNDVNILPFYTEDSVSISNRNIDNNRVFN